VGRRKYKTTGKTKYRNPKCARRRNMKVVEKGRNQRYKLIKSSEGKRNCIRKGCTASTLTVINKGERKRKGKRLSLCKEGSHIRDHV